MLLSAITSKKPGSKRTCYVEQSLARSATYFSLLNFQTTSQDWTVPAVICSYSEIVLFFNYLFIGDRFKSLYFQIFPFLLFSYFLALILFISIHFSSFYCSAPLSTSLRRRSLQIYLERLSDRLIFSWRGNKTRR